MSTSNRFDLARSQASWATLAASLPCSFLTISQPMRCVQMVSCSTAAARKVSQAATSTFLPSCRTNVGEVKALLQLAEEVLIDLAAQSKQRRDAGEDGPRPRQPLLEFIVKGTKNHLHLRP